MGLFSFLDKNKQAIDDEGNPPVKARRTRKSESGEAQEPLDPALPEKRRARRRLIGATALVLAAIIGLPMIFDSEPKPFSDDITIQIPARDAPATRLNVPSHLPPPELSPPAPAVTEVKPVLAPNPVRVETPAPVAKASLQENAPAEKEVKKEVVKEAARESAQPRVKESGKVAPKESPKANAKENAKPGVKANDKEKEKEKEKEKANNKAGTKSGNAKAQSENKNTKSAKELPIRYVLQVATVANKAKADEMQEKLKKAGIKSYSQKISTNSGDRIRIRVGPFVNKEEADKMRARLSKLGLSGSLQPV